MNTSSWGPRAWPYLHLVAQDYDNQYIKTQSPKKIWGKQRSNTGSDGYFKRAASKTKFLEENMKLYRNFFTVLQDILPCKWCRKSYRGFIADLPIDPFLEKGDAALWMYNIHNKVNAKLRDQGLLQVADPSFDSIWNRYNKILEEKDIKQADNMWYFLHTVAYNYDPELHSRDKYLDFFRLVGLTLPYGEEFTELFQQGMNEFVFREESCLDNARNLPFCIYLVHQYVNDVLGLPLQSYAATNAKYEKIRANCKVKKTNPGTCKLPERENRCKAVTGKGRQCSRDQADGCPFCTQHKH